MRKADLSFALLEATMKGKAHRIFRKFSILQCIGSIFRTVRIFQDG